MESAYAVAGSDPALLTTSGRVLVVDDDPDIRGMIEFKLGQAGYEVATADDGAAALALVEHWQPDLVVLDIAMPGLSGFDVCKRFRANPAMEAVPVIMLTARTQATFSTLGYMAGADLYLTKPISPRDLVGRIAALLSRPRERFGTAPLNDGPQGSENRSARRWWRR